MTHPTYHWTPASRAAFIAALAATGSVTRAARAAGKTRDAAYQLRRRKAEDGFRRDWDAAVLVARDHVGDAILGAGTGGVHEYAVRSTATGRTGWRRADPLLGPGYGLGLLNRLERAGARIEGDAARGAAARAVMPPLFVHMTGNPLQHRAGAQPHDEPSV